MTTATKTPPHHNTLTCYTDYQCRLPDCVDRYRAWGRQRYHAIAEGTWQPLLDAEPVRQHLLALHAAGITINRVSVLTGLTYVSVRSFTQRPYDRNRSRRHRVTPEVAAKILAIDPETTTPGKVGTTGSRRRVQALAAIGWPSAHVAQRANLSVSNRTCLLRRNTILASTAQAITTAYDEMRAQKPGRHGVRTISANRARKHAAANRWPPPKYWDETGAIDDADFTPEYMVTRAEIIAEEATWLIETGGLTRSDVAQRLGISRGYVDQAIGRTAARTAVAA